jgi:hypothetical protein
MPPQIELVQPSLPQMLRDAPLAEQYIQQKMILLKESGFLQWLDNEFERESQQDPCKAHPSQGVAPTPYDGPEISEAPIDKYDLDLFKSNVVPGMLYFLELFNHPERIQHLRNTTAYVPPAEYNHPVFAMAERERRAISINELALSAQGYEDERVGRSERFMDGPFAMLGDQPRSLLVGSANPEVWGSIPAIAHMVQTHSLCGLPRDGLFANVTRQVDLAKGVFEWLAKSPVLVGRSPSEALELLEYWRHNVMGVLEIDTKKGLARAEALYAAGVRTFRPYSPEPGSNLLSFVKALKALEKERGWEHIEIFAGQIVAVEQAIELEKAGATGLYVGIGGGGRCKTGVRAGLAIDWPKLVWKLRGHSRIPVIIEGGASDNIAATLAVGGTGIGVTRIVAGGTIESPGGLTYYKINGHKRKRYAGEASGPVKWLGGKEGPFNIIPYEEGEVSTADMQYGRGNLPSVLSRAYLINGDVIMAYVFQNSRTLAEFQQNAIKTLQITNSMEMALRVPHV